MMILMPVHAQLPCDQSKFSKRPYQPVDTKLPISGRTITASEIVERVSFKKLQPQTFFLYICFNIYNFFVYFFFIMKYGIYCEVESSGETNTTCCPMISLHDLATGFVAESFRPGELYCPGGMFIPGLPAEHSWSRYVRLLFYGIFLAYLFVGVAIIADKFMVAIEVITSKQRTVHLKNEVGELEAVKVNVWNATISNLSLMALGSSAPEILLAVIETITTLDDKPVEGLGPSCIVGSASFNLLVISAICVMSITGGDTRKIEQFGVFNITAFFSVVAYVWMYLVLSDEIVAPWEAWLTFFLFFIMVGLAYGQDQKWIWCRSKKYKVAHSPSRIGELHEKQPAQKIGFGDNVATSTYHSALTLKNQSNNAMFTEVMEEIAKERGITMAEVNPKEVAEIVAKKINDRAPKSRAYYRIKANEKMTGNHSTVNAVKRIHGDVDHVVVTKEHAARHEAAEFDGAEAKEALAAGYSIFNWSATHTSVFENEKYVTMIITRRGGLDKAAMVKYETSSGSAMAGVDFEHVQGMAKFPPQSAEFSVKVGIIDDNEYEPDENFYCRLYSPSDKNILGKHPITEVTIINDDDPGEFSVEEENINVTETSGTAKIYIVRSNGCDGAIELQYSTSINAHPDKLDAAALAETTEKSKNKHLAVEGTDYQHIEGVLKFAHQETKKILEIPIIDTKQYDKSKAFYLHFTISEFPQCGAKYGKHKTCMIKISHDVDIHKTMDEVAQLLDFNLDKFRVGTNTWAKQFAEAVQMPGPEEEGAEPSCNDYFTHFLTFYWKVLFAFVPPTSYCSGYLTFFVSLAFIGILTGIVGDVAGVFGCLLGLTPVVTAITFVALGTSLPDTFASMQAAEEADTADASIGNVTGSNSVNVFLGQGLPWVIATTYKLSKGEPFIVKAGALSFSVIVFCILAILCLTTFYIRRFFFGAELGGPKNCRNFR
jgi:solute carrier family 8 (sodium/calcium exchanger)